MQPLSLECYPFPFMPSPSWGPLVSQVWVECPSGILPSILHACCWSSPCIVLTPCSVTCLPQQTVGYIGAGLWWLCCVSPCILSAQHAVDVWRNFTECIEKKTEDKICRICKNAYPRIGEWLRAPFVVIRLKVTLFFFLRKKCLFQGRAPCVWAGSVFTGPSIRYPHAGSNLPNHKQQIWRYLCISGSLLWLHIRKTWLLFEAILVQAPTSEIQI